MRCRLLQGSSPREKKKTGGSRWGGGGVLGAAFRGRVVRSTVRVAPPPPPPHPPFHSHTRPERLHPAHLRLRRTCGRCRWRSPGWQSGCRGRGPRTARRLQQGRAGCADSGVRRMGFQQRAREGHRNQNGARSPPTHQVQPTHPVTHPPTNPMHTLSHPAPGCTPTSARGCCEQMTGPTPGQCRQQMPSRQSEPRGP